MFTRGIAVVLLVLLIIPAWAAPKQPKEYGSAQSIEKALKSNPKLVAKVFENGYTLLHWAAAKGHADVAKLLLSNGADANSMDKDGASPLHHAVASGSKPVVELLLASGAGVSLAKKDGVTPLHVAAALGKIEIAKLLLGKGADPAAQDSKNRTPVSLAQDKSYTDLVTILITPAGSSNPREDDKGDQTAAPANTASNIGNENKSPNVVTGSEADLLAIAIISGETQRAKDMIAKNPRLANAVDGDGICVLMTALDINATDIIKVLLDNGADVNLKDPDGVTPIFHALGNPDYAKMLLDRGADVNAKTVKNQFTPLHECAIYGTPEVAGMLISKGADVNAKDKDGKTPLAIANSPLGSKDVAETLKLNGAKE